MTAASTRLSRNLVVETREYVTRLPIPMFGVTKWFALTEPRWLEPGIYRAELDEDSSTAIVTEVP